MNLPDQIKTQVETANAIIEQHYGTGEGTTPPTESVEQGEGTSVAKAQSGGNEAPPVVREVSPEDENSQTYAQRWRSLQGVYQSVNTQLQQATERISQLEQLISTMQSAPPVQAQAAPAPATGGFVTQQDVEDYGQEMVEFAQRVSRSENARLQAELDRTQQVLVAMEQRLNGLQQVVPTVQQVAQNQRVSAEQEFFGRLGAMIPNWEQINADPQFHQWLLTPDPMTGITRQTYIEDAQKNLDVTRVASIFQAFNPQVGAPTQRTTTRQSNVTELERQIGPGRTLAATSPSTQEARRWTRAEISKLYDDNRRGKFAGRENEFKELERDLFAAQQDGRIAA